MLLLAIASIPVPVSVPWTAWATGASPRATGTRTSPRTTSPVPVSVPWTRTTPSAFSGALRGLLLLLFFRVLGWHCPCYNRRRRRRLLPRWGRRWGRLASTPFSVPWPRTTTPASRPTPRPTPRTTSTPHVPVRRWWRWRHAPWTTPRTTASPHMPVMRWWRWRWVEA